MRFNTDKTHMKVVSCLSLYSVVVCSSLMSGSHLLPNISTIFAVERIAESQIFSGRHVYETFELIGSKSTSSATQKFFEDGFQKKKIFVSAN